MSFISRLIERFRFHRRLAAERRFVAAPRREKFCQRHNRDGGRK